MEGASPFERVRVEGFEHLGKAALAQDALGILAHSQALRFISLVAQNVLVLTRGENSSS